MIKLNEGHTSNEIINLFNNLKENEGLKITFEIPSNLPNILIFAKSDIDLRFAGLINTKRHIDILEVIVKQQESYRITTRRIVDVTVLNEPNFILVNHKALGRLNNG